MKIALIGYGKMGMAIEEIALQRGHEIVLKTNINNLEDNTIENVQHADVAIEFTGPESAFENVKMCMDAGVPVVCGSTGWLDRFDEAKAYCEKKNSALLYSSNFSVGVNIFFAVNKTLASLMAQHNEYDVSLTEIHHTQKKRCPKWNGYLLS
jgi:4-hydroxy-tetrahydrodipicolinate reductase